MTYFEATAGGQHDVARAVTWPEASMTVGIAFAVAALVIGIVFACVYESTAKKHLPPSLKIPMPPAPPFPQWKTKTTTKENAK